ncbi:hypothetical protein DB30_07234 [Enhygromyxa salina]|uniref:Uncharacterized protein n=1 Tax=Enhygromyxa salina TaxID=215803 RepID=A0A0C2A696_9BACT|nr:hypothetical protein DB30_07234 [Enhygromyxa salina]
MVESIDVAIAHDRNALEMDAARRRARTTKAPPVRDKDQAVDNTLVTLAALLSHYAQSEVEPSTAASILATLFPVSVSHHTQLPFVEQSAANERVLSVLEGPTHKAWLDAHGITPLTKQLRAKHEEFAAALRFRDAQTAPSWDDVKAAREIGQDLYLKVVVQILASFIDDPDQRSAMMQPIWAQNEQIQAYRRQRRRPVDINPDSGEPLEDEDQDGADVQAEAEPEPPAELQIDANPNNEG